MPSEIVLDKEGLRQSLGIKGPLGRMLAGLAYKVLELEKVNAAHARHCELKGSEFSKAILEDIGIPYEFDEKQLDYIPAEGGFITVSNHHFGGADGLLLSAIVGARRPDFKILTTFMLALIPSLRDSFIPVDNFSSGGARSVSGIRTAFAHIADGNPLGLFPAGEVATWQKAGKRTAPGKGRIIEDKPWAENMIKLIRKSGFPVLPIYFDGTNSLNFHRLGRIHPRLRTLRLVHELFRKRTEPIRVRIGKPITPEEMAGMDIETLGNYLRNRCYSLEGQCRYGEEPIAREYHSEIVPQADPAGFQAEIASLGEQKLFECGSYSAYLVSESDAPALMKEIYRLRELVFRGVGEGSGNPLDTDQYDPNYKHLILWNNKDAAVAGAYRLGAGETLYTREFFRFPKGTPGGLELGRSFLAPDYQKDIFSLKNLLAALFVATLRFPDVSYYYGPVSISNTVPDFYKSLIFHYINSHAHLPEGEDFAAPFVPFVPDYIRVNPDGLMATADLDSFDRLLVDISDGAFRLPTLVRRYMEVGGKVASFSVDKDFNTLDAMILVRLSEMPQLSLRMLLRSLPNELQKEVFVRFYGTEDGFWGN